MTRRRTSPDAFPDRGRRPPTSWRPPRSARRSELARRKTDARRALDAVQRSDTNAAQIAAAIQALRIVFGRNTLAVMPAFALQGGDELRKSLAKLANRPPDHRDPTSFDAHQAPGRFLQQACACTSGSAPGAGSAVRGRVRARPRRRVASRSCRSSTSETGRDARRPPTEPDVAGAGVGERADRRPQPSQAVARPAARSVDRDRAERQGGDRAGVPLRQPELRGAAGDPDGDALRAGHAEPGRLLELHSIVNETIDLARSRARSTTTCSRSGSSIRRSCVASNSQNNVVSTQLRSGVARQGPPIVG